MFPKPRLVIRLLIYMHNLLHAFLGRLRNKNTMLLKKMSSVQSTVIIKLIECLFRKFLFCDRYEYICKYNCLYVFSPKSKYHSYSKYCLSMYDDV